MAHICKMRFPGIRVGCCMYVTNVDRDICSLQAHSFMVMLRINSSANSQLPNDDNSGGFVKCFRLMLLPIGIKFPFYCGLLVVCYRSVSYQLIEFAVPCALILPVTAWPNHGPNWCWIDWEIHLTFTAWWAQNVASRVALNRCANGICHIAPYIRIHHCHVVCFHTRSTQLCWFCTCLLYTSPSPRD